MPLGESFPSGPICSPPKPSPPSQEQRFLLVSAPHHSMLQRIMRDTRHNGTGYSQVYKIIFKVKQKTTTKVLFVVK